MVEPAVEIGWVQLALASALILVAIALSAWQPRSDGGAVEKSAGGF